MNPMNKSLFWKIRHSWWILLTFTLFFNWIAFIYIGSKAKTMRWGLWGLFYALPFMVMFAGLFEDDSWQYDLFMTYFLMSGIGSIFHAFKIRKEFLLRLAVRQMAAGSADDELMRRIQREYAVKHTTYSSLNTSRASGGRQQGSMLQEDMRVVQAKAARMNREMEELEKMLNDGMMEEDAEVMRQLQEVMDEQARDSQRGIYAAPAGSAASPGSFASPAPTAAAPSASGSFGTPANTLFETSVPRPDLDVLTRPARQETTPPPAASTLSSMPTMSEFTHLQAQMLDLNFASETEIAALSGIGIVLAKKAVQVRQANGGFRSVDEFARELGLKPHIVERIRPLVTVGTVNTPPQNGKGRVVDY
ncbi:helix-hairpin-helix domain-containing protein [Paenibacillaceae bacterium]|nr:helix-hairpin-helix domain-containing protein [Paenibacillaceae bacterium]